MRRTFLTAAVLALFLAASAGAARVATDPLSGAWKITRGGKGTFSVARRGSLLGFFAKTPVKLGCVKYLKGDTVGFAELPSHTKLPRGTYNATFGVPGQGCSYTVHLKLTGRTMSAKVLYSEDGLRAGPFAFARP